MNTPKNINLAWSAAASHKKVEATPSNPNANPELAKTLEQEELKKQRTEEIKNTNREFFTIQTAPKIEGEDYFVQSPKRSNTTKRDSTDKFVHTHLRLPPVLDTQLEKLGEGSKNNIITALLMHALKDLQDNNKVLIMEEIKTDKG